MAPLVGLAGFPESCQRCAVAHMGSCEAFAPLCEHRGPSSQTGHSPALGQKASTPPPVTVIFLEIHDESSLRLWLPSRVSPDITAMRHLVNEIASLLPRFSAPSAFSERRGATYLRQVPDLSGYVASSGFRSLSTLCSPRRLPGLFHPGPALGVHPSRFFSAHCAVRPLRRRFPLGVSPGLTNSGCPFRVISHSRQHARRPGV